MESSCSAFLSLAYLNNSFQLMKSYSDSEDGFSWSRLFKWKLHLQIIAHCLAFFFLSVVISHLKK